MLSPEETESLASALSAKVNARFDEFEARVPSIEDFVTANPKVDDAEDASEDSAALSADPTPEVPADAELSEFEQWKKDKEEEKFKAKVLGWIEERGPKPQTPAALSSGTTTPAELTPREEWIAQFNTTTGFDYDEITKPLSQRKSERDTSEPRVLASHIGQFGNCPDA